MQTGSREERSQQGRARRAEVPRRRQGEWAPAPERPDPVDLLLRQDADRLGHLVPIRHWRMSRSPFTFYRGAAAVMAADLATTPSTGLQAQLSGDAHLSNFGVYGSPERDLVFDLNDFDETLPGPWEWDVKRLATSFAIAARHNDDDEDDQRLLARAAVASYREAMIGFAGARHIDVWYAHVDIDDLRAEFGDQLSRKQSKRLSEFVSESRGRTSLKVFRKLTEEVDGVVRIASQPPLIIPARDVADDLGTEDVAGIVDSQVDSYLRSVRDHVAVLLGRYQRRDLALKVVGVGSVGTRCLVMLLVGDDADDPFFLQIKEAGRSVLEDHLPSSRYADHGRRVVEGQRLMQATSDSFLGWTEGPGGRHYYWRQYKDMKGSVDVEGASVRLLARYARLCGWTLARAHARSGDPAAIAGYLGKGSNVDRAVADFAISYADQNDRDFAAFIAAIEDGRVTAHE